MVKAKSMFAMFTMIAMGSLGTSLIQGNPRKVCRSARSVFVAAKSGEVAKSGKIVGKKRKSRKVEQRNGSHKCEVMLK